jgi:hypothetical protein
MREQYKYAPHRFFCECCKYSCYWRWKILDHKASDRHLKKSNGTYVHKKFCTIPGCVWTAQKACHMSNMRRHIARHEAKILENDLQKVVS